MGVALIKGGNRVVVRLIQDPTPPVQMPPELPEPRTPSLTIRTSVATAYATVVPSSGEWPSGVVNKERNSPSESWHLPVSSWE